MNITEKKELIEKLKNAYTTCMPCGRKYGVYSVGCSSVWNGKCDVCEKETRVTECRDFAYFVTGIRKLQEEINMKTKTTETTPVIQTDWEQQYQDERKNRLADSILEYAEDENGSHNFYHDLQDVIHEQILHHEEELNRLQGILKLLK